MQPLYILESIDFKRADQPDSSRALTISKLGVPGMKRKTSGYAPGGGIAEINWVFPILDPIVPKWEMKGYDLDLLQSYGMAAGSGGLFSFNGAIRVKQGGKMIPSRYIVEGVIEEWTPDEYTPGTLMGCNYTMAEVTHASFEIDGREIFYFDSYTNIFRSGGVDRFADNRIALGN